MCVISNVVMGCGEKLWHFHPLSKSLDVPPRKRIFGALCKWTKLLREPEYSYRERYIDGEVVGHLVSWRFESMVQKASSDQRVCTVLSLFVSQITIRSMCIYCDQQPYLYKQSLVSRQMLCAVSYLQGTRSLLLPEI